jgi:hypothetical protein
MIALRKIAALAVFPAALQAQLPAQRDTVFPIKAPTNPLPTSAASAGVTKFSFITYGDTRGRHDGVDTQAEHTLVMEAMLAAIKRAAGTDDPIRFVLQSGDAVQNGAIARQLSVSYVPIINRLTQEGGIPYFLSVGNHDVGNATDLTDVRRVEGLHNFLAANALLIPPDGAPHRLAGYPAYGFGYGNTFFIAFDSDIPDDAVQFAWVKKELEGLDRTRYVNVAMFFHHPPFSSGPHGGATLERQAASIRKRWMPLFRAHHVRLLLTGHEHLYEHWVEHYVDQSGAHRMDEIVSGGGGAPLYGYTGEPDLRAYRDENAATKTTVEHLARPSSEPGANPFHFVIVHVDGENLSLEVVGADWGKNFAPYRTNRITMSDKPPL